MTRKTPNPIDVHVGSRLRMRRMLVGMSQDKLGESLDLTFQQVQKYEKGSNRISASRLYDLSRILEVPVQFFFDDLPGSATANMVGTVKPAGSVEMIDFLSSSEGAQLVRSFSEISSPAVRRNILELVKSISHIDGAQSDQG
jgi:transcriptional regulator with XRE-family HTH domain